MNSETGVLFVKVMVILSTSSIDQNIDTTGKCLESKSKIDSSNRHPFVSAHNEFNRVLKIANRMRHRTNPHKLLVIKIIGSLSKKVEQE